MKKMYLNFALVITSTLVFTLSAAAQGDLGIDPEHMPDLSRFFIANETKDSVSDDVPAFVDDKAARNFNRQFPKAVHPSWYQFENGYLVRFQEENIQTDVVLDHKGRFHHKIAYYQGTLLPKAIRSVVENEFDEYVIMDVSEVNFNNPYSEPIYVVRIENCKRFKMVSVASETILSVKEYRKG